MGKIVPQERKSKKMNKISSLNIFIQLNELS